MGWSLSCALSRWPRLDCSFEPELCISLRLVLVSLRLAFTVCYKSVVSVFSYISMMFRVYRGM